MISLQYLPGHQGQVTIRLSMCLSVGLYVCLSISVYLLGAAGVAGAVVYAALLEVTTPKIALLIQLVVPVILAVRYVVCIHTYVCTT